MRARTRSTNIEQKEWVLPPVNFSNGFKPKLHTGLLSEWASRFSQSTTGSIALSSRSAEFEGGFDDHISRLHKFFGCTDNIGHSFHVAPVNWLSLTEPQTILALASILHGAPGELVLAFLKALDPDEDWPTTLTDIEAIAEAVTETGRIDLLIMGKSAGRDWRIAIEAKYRHHLKDNDLATYRKTVEQWNERKKPIPRCRFYILGLNKIGLKVISHYERKRWKFVHWEGLIRRFEHELSAMGHNAPDPDFQLLRRTIWNKL